jgi:hypothetical protein
MACDSIAVEGPILNKIFQKRHKPEPRRQLSAIPKGTGITHRRDYCRGNQRSHALDFSEPAAGFRGGKDALNPHFDLVELLVQCHQLPIEVFQEFPSYTRQLLGGVL